ncbi:hypothetical protein P7C70_g3201, partial [Phenoliferia sp. Uapishka_3]
MRRPSSFCPVGPPPAHICTLLLGFSSWRLVSFMLTRLRSWTSPSLKSAALSSSRCSFCGTRLAQSPTATTSDIKGKSVLRPSNSSRSYSTAARLAESIPQAAPFDSPSTLDQFSSALAASNLKATAKHIQNLTPSDRANLSRQTFDSAFSLFADPPDPTVHRRRIAWGNLVYLRELAAERGWTLSDDQNRVMFEVGVDMEENRPQVVPTSETQRVQQRGRHLRELWEEVIHLPRSTGQQLEKDALVLERHRLSGIRHGKTALREAAGLASRARAIVELAFPDPTTIPSLTPDSRRLSRLFSSDRTAALAHLHKMLDVGRVPAVQFMRQQVLEEDGRTDESYDHAREALEAACSNSVAASMALEELHAERLARLDRVAWIEEYPQRAFLLMLSNGPKAPMPNDPTRAEYIFIALRLWEGLVNASYTPATYRLLEDLIHAFLDLPVPPHPSPSPPPALLKAVELISIYLPTPRLVALSHHMLNALTLSYPSVSLSRSFYSTLRTRAPFNSAIPFQWHSNLRDCWVYLVKTTVYSSAPDPQLGLRLYLDWTASGLLPPANSWEFLWRTLGTVAAVEDTERLVQDYERAGKILQPSAASTVIRGAVNSGRLLGSLQLLAFFRERFPGARGGGKIQPHVPLDAFNAVLQFLAESKHDRRIDSLSVFRQLIEDGITPNVTTWNALLASHVFLSTPLIRADLVAAAKVYEHIIQQKKLESNSMTFSLLMHGGLRVATQDPNNDLGLGSATKAFQVATERKVLVRGEQLAMFIKLLGRQGRWEEAKTAGELWWALAALRKHRSTAEKQEETLVRDAGRLLVKWEAQVARSAWMSRKDGQVIEESLLEECSVSFQLERQENAPRTLTS